MLGAMGILGWYFDTPFLTTLVHGQPAMKPNTAVALSLAGVGGALRYNERAGRMRRSMSWTAAVVVLFIAVGTLAEYGLDLDLRIDQALFTDQPGPYPGRPSPPTALALGLLALALLVFDRGRRARVAPSEALVLVAGFAAFVALLGFVFGAGPLYRLPGAPVVGVAVPTAVALFAIAAGLLLERPHTGFMQLMTSSGPGGILLRRFVPAALLAPMLLKVLLGSLFASDDIESARLMFATLVTSVTMLGLLLVALTALRLERTEAVLEASRVRIRALVEQAPDGIFVADLDGHYREVNQAGCRMLGYSRSELLDKTIMDLIPPGDVERLLQSREQMLSGSVHVAEWALRQRNGALLPVEVSAVILPDGRWQGIVRDVSERKRARDELRQAQERFELALRGADLATWDWNISSGEVVFNQRWAEMRGYRLDEIEPHVDSWLAGIHPDDLPRVRQALDAYFQGRAIEYETEVRVRTKSGAWIWILDRGKVFERDARGQPVRMVGTELDITARRQAEEALRLAEAKSTGILSISADAIISIDEDQRITMFNAGAERIFGYTRAEIVGAPLDRLFPERFRTVHRQHVAKFAANLEAARRMGQRGAAIFGLRKDGEEFPADAAISKLEIDGTRILTVALRDITDQKRLEDGLRKAVQSRDEVMGIVAHDLRNPLGSILLQASLLRRREPDAERRSAKPVEVIERAARRMNHLIEDLLDVTRIDAGRLSVEPARTAAARVLVDAVETQKPIASSASLELHVNVGKDLPEVWADPGRVLQVLENLIGNAVKFTEAGGHITVGAAAGDGEVLFWVSDTGAGIPPEELPHLFDRFWQARAARRSGAGLGLAIVKGIVEAHNGRIWVESRLGQGSTFFFTIPVASPARDFRSEAPLH